MRGFSRFIFLLVFECIRFNSIFLILLQLLLCLCVHGRCEVERAARENSLIFLFGLSWAAQWVLPKCSCLRFGARLDTNWIMFIRFKTKFQVRVAQNKNWANFSFCCCRRRRRLWVKNKLSWALTSPRRCDLKKVIKQKKTEKLIRHGVSLGWKNRQTKSWAAEKIYRRKSEIRLRLNVI